MTDEAPPTASGGTPPPPTFGAETLQEIEELRTKYPTARGALLPTLWLAQRDFGQVTPAIMELVADTLGVPACQALTAATFYTLYQRDKPPEHKLQLCTNISCMLYGAYDLLHFLEDTLGIKAGEYTPDGRIYLEEVECLASCGTAPTMQVGDRYVESLTQESALALLKDIGVSV